MFRKRNSTGTLTPIAAFWDWWSADGGELIASAIGAGDPARVDRLLSKRVQSIHPGLSWETSEGACSTHRLCLSAGGVADLRPLAERWIRSAPAASATWEFSSSRQRTPNGVVNAVAIAGQVLELDQARLAVTVDNDRWLAQVSVFHPAFPDMHEKERLPFVFLLLDWLLGEDDVERWIEHVEAATDEPEGSISGRALVVIVDEMAERLVEPVWVLVATPTTDARRILLARRPLRWIDHPCLDLHSQIRITYMERRDDGLPTPYALERLREVETDLVEALGPRGLFVAHETSEGERLLHFYSDTEDQNARDLIDGYCQPLYGVSAVHELDPSWTHVRGFT